MTPDGPAVTQSPAATPVSRPRRRNTVRVRVAQSTLRAIERYMLAVKAYVGEELTAPRVKDVRLAQEKMDRALVALLRHIRAQQHTWFKRGSKTPRSCIAPLLAGVDDLVYGAPEHYKRLVRSLSQTEHDDT